METELRSFENYVENPRNRSAIAGMIAVLAIVVFVALLLMITLLNVTVLETLATITFYIFIIALFIYLYFKGSKSISFIRSHWLIAFGLFVGLVISSTQTGLFPFIYSGPYTIQNAVSIFLNIFVVSQTAQSQGIQGGFNLLSFLFGFFWMIALILFWYDIVSLTIKGGLGHSLFPLKAEAMAGLTLVTVIGLAFLIYTLLIWTGTSMAGHFEINPFFGTVNFVSAAVQGQVNLSAFQPGYLWG